METEGHGVSERGKLTHIKASRGEDLGGEGWRHVAIVLWEEFRVRRMRNDLDVHCKYLCSLVSAAQSYLYEYPSCPQ